MGRYGFGFFGRYRGIATPGGGGGGSVATIRPSASWNGTASSGFAKAPSDPVRTTAKPAIRLVVAPRQAFTDELLIGVYAGANDRGTLITNMGLEKVTAYYEGTSIDINAPSFRTFADANGHPVTYYGWWIKLKHNGVNGYANLYFEATPRDPTMQKRVIGPYVFLPSAALYDYDVEVAASKAEVPGVRYQSVKNALTYLRAAAAKHPRIRMTEAYSGDASGPASPYVAEGYCTIEATAPVLFRKTSATRDELRFTYDRIRFRGQNITFDTRYISRLQPYNKGNFQFDGVNFLNSGGRDELWNKGDRPAAHMVSYAETGESPWFTECSFDNTSNSVMQRAYARGCMFHMVAPDLADACRLLLSCAVNDLDNTTWRTEIDALRVQYGGLGASATLAFSGTLGSSPRVFTAKVAGTIVSTFTLGGATADFTAGTNYDVADVVTWLNSLDGWTATLLDDTRKGVLLGLANTNGNNFVDTDTKTAALTLVTQTDYHPDIMQRTSDDENVVIADNSGFNIVAQAIFLSRYNLSDTLVVNNAFADKSDVTGGSYYSQVSGKHGHVVIAHNTLATQGMLMRSDTGYTVDGYCMIANNAFRSLEWYGTPDAGLKISNNHLQSGASVPANSKGTTVGGNRDSLFANALDGDFRPAGALLANLKTPVVSYDAGYLARAAIASSGARV